MDTDKELGARIAEARHAAGYNQTDLSRLMVAAGRVNYTQMTVSRTEKGQRTVGAFEVRDIARVLGVTVDSLLGEAPPSRPNVTLGIKAAIEILTEHLNLPESGAEDRRGKS